MTEPIVPVLCFKCGANCFPCSCAPCPVCEGMLCATCEIKSLPITHEYATQFGLVSSSIRRDVPIPPHPGSRRCCTEKEPDKIEVVPAGSFDRSLYHSDQYISDDARLVAGALWKMFGFAAAGVVAASCAVMLAAAAVFSGEVPE